MTPPSPFAWPDGWERDQGYVELRKRLLFEHGPERTAQIIAGQDEASNRDLWLWRRIGGGV